MAEIKVTLIKSVASRMKKQRNTVAALGLRKIGACKIFEDTPALRGMLAKVSHLVKIEDDREVKS